jgi:outer membrane protein insertion porin family
VDDNAPFLIKRQAAENGGESTTSAISGALSRDSRDPIGEPVRGNRSRIAATFAGGPLGFDNNFVKGTIESSQYWPLWWKFVLNLRGAFWAGKAFGDTDTLPVQERFFIGGANSVRGFRNFTISPTDPAGGDGLTGGNKAYFVNADLIFPLYEAMRLRGVVFFDVGNNLDERNRWWDLWTEEPRIGAGVGVRFNSPIGAIRLDWGFNLNRRENEKMQVLHFTAGTAF